MSFGKHGLLGTASTTLVLLLVACGGGESSGAPGDAGGPDPSAEGRGTILRVAYDREIDVLNPLTSQNLVDIQFSMMEGLVTTDEHNRYVPVLAARIPTEENGLIVRNDDGAGAQVKRIGDEIQVWRKLMNKVRKVR